MIKLDEQTIIDQAWDLDYVKPLPPQRLTDQTVAVVGSGPAGLAAAQDVYKRQAWLWPKRTAAV